MIVAITLIIVTVIGIISEIILLRTLNINGDGFKAKYGDLIEGLSLHGFWGKYWKIYI